MPAKKKEEPLVTEPMVTPPEEPRAEAATRESRGVLEEAAALLQETTIYGLWSPSLQLWWPPQAANGAIVFHTSSLGVAQAQLRNVLSQRNGGQRRDWTIREMGETPPSKE